jgi:glyoxylase-like metal-dependent hydrolase (beta-lactamase superfamily II)
LLRHPRLTLVEDGDEISPGVTALVTPGHTPGHASYVVTSSSGKRLVVFGDVFHSPAQLAHPDWGSAPDIDADLVLQARARVLTELLVPDTYGFAFHFGDQSFGRVVQDQGLAAWEPIPTQVL